MGRNQLIDTLADCAIIVASDAEKGGTWAGATEALRTKRIPIFVLEHPKISGVIKKLFQKGAIGFPHPLSEDRRRFAIDWKYKPLKSRLSRINPAYSKAPQNVLHRRSP